MMEIDDFLDRELDILGKRKSIEEVDKAKTHEEVNDILNKIREHIKKKEFVLAEELYARIQRKLADEPIEHKIAVYDQLTEINKTLLKSLNELSVEMEGKISLIHSLIQKGRENIGKGRLDMAQKIYGEVNDMYLNLPDAFIERKRSVQNEVFEFYKEMKENLNKDSVTKFNEEMKKIIQIIAKARYYLDKKDVDKAADIYKECVSAYNKLPIGFLREKARTYNEILKLYEEINININILGLQEKLHTMEKPGTSGIKKPEIGTLRPVVLPQSGLVGISKEMPKQGEKIQLKKEKSHKEIIPGEKKDRSLKERLIKRRKERGILKFSKGAYDKAIADFEAVLRLDPDDSEALDLINKAVDASKRSKEKKEPPKTKKIEKPEINIAPLTAEVDSSTKKSLIQRRKERGIFEMNKGRYDKALGNFEAILRIDPDNSEVKRLLDKVKGKKLHA